MALVGRNETLDVFIRQCAMFRFSARDPLAPHFEAAGLHIGSHYFDYFRLGDAEPVFNNVEGRAVFPSHSDNPVDVRFA